MTGLDQFPEVWLEDFEFSVPSGENPKPICMVAKEYKTGKILRLWQKDLAEPPFSLGPDALHVAYYSSAEWNCYLALAWQLPAHVLDLFAEFRNITNGLPTVAGNGLLGALAQFGIVSADAEEKEEMRQLALRGGPFSPDEKSALLDYCQSDVESLYKLLFAMLPHIDFPRALLRGRYMKAAARIETTGVPIDVGNLCMLYEKWEEIKRDAVSQVDAHYGVYENGAFKKARFADYLSQNDIPWPRLESGALNLRDQTFKDMAESYPLLNNLRELRYLLSQLRLNDIAVGSDGRNRCLLSAFRARSGRNAPSNAKFIFGPAVWLRALIKPELGKALAYIDWSQQEFGIAAALSGDRQMLRAYESGDPYLQFAKQAGAVPSDATKDSHPAERSRYKACALGVLYGMGAESLAQRIREPTIVARGLLEAHRRTYRQFWQWSDSVADYAVLYGKLHTIFGWTLHVRTDFNPRSLRNFPMQANGAEMLRLACCLATERGIAICAPVHDAMLIEGPADEINCVVLKAQKAMAEASAIVLDGFELRTDTYIIQYPDRYQDNRGSTMWDTIMEIAHSITT